MDLSKIIAMTPTLLLSLFCMASLLIVSKPKYSMKITLVVSIIFTLLLTTINFSLFFGKSVFTFQRWFFLSVFIPEAIVAAILSKRTKFSLLTAILNAYISFYILFSTSMALNHWFPALIYDILLIVIGSCFLFIYLKKYYVKIHNEIEQTLPTFFKYLVIYAALLFAEISIYQFLIGAVDSPDVLRFEIFVVAIISVYILSIIFINYLIKQYHSKIVELKDKEWLENHLQYTIEQIRQNERKENEIRILHHDIKHILSTTSALIKKGEKDKALDFLKKYTNLIDKTRRVKFCEDTLINASLDYYYHICKEKKIKFNCKINDIESALNIPSHEIAVVISNCLENAVNASMRLEKNRLINLSFINNDGRLILKIENNYDGFVEYDENNLPTNRNDNHGIGTTSIAHFAKRNDLIVDYNITHDKFQITILFK